MQSCYVARRPEFTRNLLALYRQATDADIEQGLAWYPAMYRIVCDWAHTYQLPVQVVANVVAAISPQCEWERNLIIADDILAGRPPSIGGAIYSHVRKAKVIRDTCEYSIARYFPCGPKVLAFAGNLAGDWNQVTVDTHGQQAVLNDVETRDSMHPVRYYIIAEAFKHGAAYYQLAPAFFQAVIWHIWKRLHPRTAKIQHRQQWYAVGEPEE